MFLGFLGYITGCTQTCPRFLRLLGSESTLFEPPANFAFVSYQCPRLPPAPRRGPLNLESVPEACLPCSCWRLVLSELRRPPEVLLRARLRLEMDQVVLHVLGGNTARDMVFNPITGVWEDRGAGSNSCSLLNYCSLSKLSRAMSAGRCG